MWEEDVAAFTLANLPQPSSRVLEVGCGEGALALRLAEAGHEVRAIDPHAPEGEIFEQVTLEEFTPTTKFDAVVAVLSLHHIDRIDTAVAKIAGMLEDAGRIVAIEFAWDRFDDRTGAWVLDNLDDDPEGGWLYRRKAEWDLAGELGRDISFAEAVQEWAAAERMHPSTKMFGALGGWFYEKHFEWAPYLYPDLAPLTKEDEAAAIATGTIQPIGFRFVGSVSP